MRASLVVACLVVAGLAPACASGPSGASTPTGSARGADGRTAVRALEPGAALGYRLEDPSGRPLGAARSTFDRSEDGFDQLVTRVERGGVVVEHALTFRRDGSPVRYKRLSSAGGRRVVEFTSDGVVVDDDGRTSQALRGDRVRTPVVVLGDVALLQHYLASLRADVLDLLEPERFEKLRPSVTRDGPRVRLAGPRGAGEVELSEGGEITRATLDGVVYVRTPTPPRIELKLPEAELGYVRPAAVRFRDEPLAVPLADGRVAGTLSVPVARPAKPTVVVFVQDRGLQDRDGRDTRGIAWATRELLDALADEGAVVARLDDVGAGESAASTPPGARGLGVRAGELERVVAALRQDARFEGARFALVGHGLGGLVALVAAPRVGAERLALLATPGRTPIVYLADRLAALGESAPPAERERLARVWLDALGGAPAAEATIGAARRAAFADDARLLADWAALDLDAAAAALGPTNATVLLVQGLKDLEVAWREDGDAWTARLRRALGKERVTLKAFDHTDHLLKAEPRASSFTRYEDPGRRVEPRVVAELVRFFTREGP
jgi:alpha-beta hydrolase superfamily lysophospholipase